MIPAPTGIAPQASGFRHDIEGLRGIAVLLVVLYHAGAPGWSGGFVGVDTFFVLSGYLITGLLVRELERTGRIDFAQFYARRARRLLPASALVLLATVLTSAVVLSPIEQADVARTAAATATYASNLYFLLSKGDYFSRHTEGNPLVHTWSLSVEEQFYFVWPLLVLLVFRWGRSRRSVGLVLGALTLASLGVSIAVTQYRQPWAFFGTPFRAWEFGVGGLVSLFALTDVVRQSAVRVALGWVGLAALIAAATGFSKSTPFPGVAAMLPAFGSAAVVAAGAGPGVRTVLTNPILRGVGQFSYGWYLWHWPVIVLASAIVPHLALAARVLCMLLALAFAVGTYYAVENPVRFHPALSARPARSIVSAALVTCASLAVGLGGRLVASWLGRADGQRAISAAVLDRTPLWASGCMVMFTDARARGCISGPPTAGTTVVLFGDSHAAHWYPALDRIAHDRGWRVVSYVKASCPAERVPLYNPEIGRVERECGIWREDALRQITALRPALVLVSSSAAYVAGNRPPDGYAQLSYAQWQRGLRSTAMTLDSAGLRTFVVRDVPFLRTDVPVCLSRALVRTRLTTDACAVRESAALDPAVGDAERAAVKGLTRVTTLDLTDEFCRGGVCEAIRDGYIVYHDESHLTASFARELAPVLEARIETALGRGPA